MLQFAENNRIVFENAGKYNLKFISKQRQINSYVSAELTDAQIEEWGTIILYLFVQ